MNKTTQGLSANWNLGNPLGAANAGCRTAFDGRMPSAVELVQQGYVDGACQIAIAPAGMSGNKAVRSSSNKLYTPVANGMPANMKPAEDFPGGRKGCSKSQTRDTMQIMHGQTALLHGSSLGRSKAAKRRHAGGLATAGNKVLDLSGEESLHLSLFGQQAHMSAAYPVNKKRHISVSMQQQFSCFNHHGSATAASGQPPDQVYPNSYFAPVMARMLRQQPAGPERPQQHGAFSSSADVAAGARMYSQQQRSANGLTSFRGSMPQQQQLAHGQHSKQQQQQHVNWSLLQRQHSMPAQHHMPVAVSSSQMYHRQQQQQQEQQGCIAAPRQPLFQQREQAVKAICAHAAARAAEILEAEMNEQLSSSDSKGEQPCSTQGLQLHNGQSPEPADSLGLDLVTALEEGDTGRFYAVLDMMK